MVPFKCGRFKKQHSELIFSRKLKPVVLKYAALWKLFWQNESRKSGDTRVQGRKSNKLSQTREPKLHKIYLNCYLIENHFCYADSSPRVSRCHNNLHNFFQPPDGPKSSQLRGKKGDNKRIRWSQGALTAGARYLYRYHCIIMPETCDPPPRLSP